MTPEPEGTPRPASDRDPEASVGDGPLSSTQLQELATAIARARKVLGAAKVAAFTGWTVGAFGVLSMLVSLMSLSGLVVGGALIAVAWNELQGRDLLRKFDPVGPRRLAQNQLWLLALIVVYCLGSIYVARVHPNPSWAQLEELAGLGEGFMSGITTTLYVGVLAVGGIFQWGMYRYHAARIALVDQYLAETPAWIVEIQRVVEGG